MRMIKGPDSRLTEGFCFFWLGCLIVCSNDCSRVCVSDCISEGGEDEGSSASSDVDC